MMPRKGAVVVVQEVFGVNAHIRDVCGRFAELGYSAIAPALFDRIQPGIELDYDEQALPRGASWSALGWDAHARYLGVGEGAASRRQGRRRRLLGRLGRMARRLPARCRLRLRILWPAIVEFLGEKRCPAIAFRRRGRADPPENVEKIRAAYPDVPIYVYEGAGHGFNCDRRADFRPEVATVAQQRTLALFAKHLDG